jgi:hypothetical protein
MLNKYGKNKTSINFSMRDCRLRCTWKFVTAFQVLTQEKGKLSLLKKTWANKIFLFSFTFDGQFHSATFLSKQKKMFHIVVAFHHAEKIKALLTQK